MSIARRCLKCGKKMYIIGTWSLPNGSKLLRLKHRYYRRRLECARCGERITTYEIDQRDFHRLIDKIRETEKAIDHTDHALHRIEKEIDGGRSLLAEIKDDN